MSQSTIEIESAAGRLLRALAISQVIPIIGPDPAADWLVKREYARWGDWKHSKLYITSPRYDADHNRMPGPETGQEHYEALCRNPVVTDSAAAWKAEALSGMASVPGPLGTRTKQSDISRAVIPSPAPPRSPKTPEDEANRNERAAAMMKKWMTLFDCTEEELRRYGDEGRIRMCGQCGGRPFPYRPRVDPDCLLRNHRQGRRIFVPAPFVFFPSISVENPAIFFPAGGGCT